MFKRSGTGNFAYTSSRVKAKKSKLLKAEDYNKLQAMSVPEISRYISESGYSKEMTDLAGMHDGLELVEYATYGNMAKAFRSILGAASGDCKNMVGAYLKKWDYINALTILRGKRYGLPLDEIRGDLVVAGYLNMEDFEKLMQMANVEDILASFCTLMHIRIPEEVLAVYKAQSDLAPVEDALVITYCTGGVRGANVAEVLSDLGFTNVKVYTAGFAEWAGDKSYEVEAEAEVPSSAAAAAA